MGKPRDDRRKIDGDVALEARAGASALSTIDRTAAGGRSSPRRRIGVLDPAGAQISTASEVARVGFHRVGLVSVRRDLAHSNLLWLTCQDHPMAHGFLRNPLPRQQS